MRMFPSYTLAELKQAADQGITVTRTAETLAKIKTEIAAREAGSSVQRVTPQVSWADLKK
jgi:hypothetical protein